MHAGRRGAHVAAGSAAGGRARRWRRVGTALCVLPWALVLLVTGAPGAWASLRMGEHFPETGNAGYFLIKLAMLLLALLLAVQALQMLWRRRRGPTGRP
jgi:TRAP-type mannitol/chloroaromatic compound transport system permease small subunit